MRDRVRDDWAVLASLAEVHEQDRPPSRRVKTKAADRLWAEIERLRAQVADDKGLSEAVDILLNSRFVAGEHEVSTSFWQAVDGKITMDELRDRIL